MLKFFELIKRRLRILLKEGILEIEHGVPALDSFFYDFLVSFYDLRNNFTAKDLIFDHLPQINSGFVLFRSLGLPIHDL